MYGLPRSLQGVSGVAIDIGLDCPNQEEGVNFGILEIKKPGNPGIFV